MGTLRRPESKDHGENGTPRVGPGKQTEAGRRRRGGPSHGEMGRGLSEAAKGLKCLQERKGQLCFQVSLCKPLEPQMSTLRPTAARGLPRGLRGLGPENKARARPVGSPGCRRPRAAGWGQARPGWRRLTRGGGPGGARGRRQRETSQRASGQRADREQS